MNFKNFKQLKLRKLWQGDFSGLQYPLVAKSHLYNILQNSYSYRGYIEKLISKSNNLSFRYYKEDSIPIVRTESAIYLRGEAERAKQEMERNKSKNMEV